MPKELDERTEPAKQMYLDGMRLIDIAKQLDLPEGAAQHWRSTHKWDGGRSDKEDTSVRKRRGDQPGDKNAIGPPGNHHVEKHGFFTKWLPEEAVAIIDEIHGDDPLGLL